MNIVDYGIRVYNYDPEAMETRGTPLVNQEIDSKEEVEALKKELIDNDPERKPLYFPLTFYAAKIGNCVVRFFCLIVAFTLDLLTFPLVFPLMKYYIYPPYLQELKDQLPLYKFLKKYKVSDENLKKENFEVVFFTGQGPEVKKVVSNLQKAGIADALEPRPLPPALRREPETLTKHYLEYEVFGYALSSGPKYIGGGWTCVKPEFERHYDVLEEFDGR